MKNFQKKSSFFKAISDPVRIDIITLLLSKQSPVCICDLSKSIPKDQSVIFRHVQLLVQAGIISAEKEGKFLMCRIKEKKRIQDLLDSAK